MDMTGKTVLITGASRGIGASAAQIFAAQGANVALLARSADAVEALAAEIGTRALAIEADVSSWEDMEAAVRTCVARFGRLDVLIGNAGVIEPIAPMAASVPAAWAV